VRGTPAAQPDRFSIPDLALDLELEQLPMSGRLIRALNPMDIRRLGDLQGRLVGEFLGIPKCPWRHPGETSHRI